MIAGNLFILIHQDSSQGACPLHSSSLVPLMGGVLFYESRKLTYFHGGKRKYSVLSTDFGKKTVMEKAISYFRGSENGNCQYNSHGH